jgi:hypothetical protein
VFLNNWRELLGDNGYTPDPGTVERTGDNVVLYHYTRPEHLEAIMAPGSGLRARIWMDASEISPELGEGNLAEGFLEPMPQWLTASPYFSDLGLEMARDYIGNLLLRIEVPIGYAGLYVADYAHTLECKHIDRRGFPALDLGYDCTNGQECSKAYLHSFVPLPEYRGGHVAPVVQMLRHGPGIAIPNRYITVADRQPLIEEPL